MKLETMMSESSDVYLCTRMFSNAFKIKETPEGKVKKSSSRIRRARIMASSKTSSPELGSSPCSKNQNLDCTAICSPDAQNSTPQKQSGIRSAKLRFPLEEFDPNSQDSGYGGCNEEKSQQQRSSFHFAEPLGVAPRRLSLDSRSPANSPQCKRLFRSLSSGYDSMDDGINDLIDMESLDVEILPDNLSNLISGHIVGDEKQPMVVEAISTTPEAAAGTNRPCFNLRRSISMQTDRLQKDPSEEYSPPSSASKVRSCLFRSPNASSSTAKLTFDESPRIASALVSPPARINFKRPEPPADHSPVLLKRSRKCTSYQDVNVAVKAELDSSPPLLQRSQSETAAQAHIKSALNRSTTDADLTGDFSKPCILPLAEGRHEDLKSITPETLSRLINGEFADFISDYKIVDCRYPYEYEAGHIGGALNLYTKDMIEQFLLDPLKHTPVEIEPTTNRRSILVFHCEFSWERGPNLSRFLRNIDRQRNKEHYPALHYPEVYLLHGGYKDFYNHQKQLCTPQGYRPMRHPDHEDDLRQFRSKSKSWQGEKSSIRANVVTARANLKRLGF